MLGGLLISFSHSATTTAPLIIPISVVAPESLPTPVRQPEKLPPAPQKPTAELPRDPIPPPPSKPRSATTGFNPYLLNSAQFNPAIFGNTAANAANTAAAPPSLNNATPTTPRPSVNSTLGVGNAKRLISVHRSFAHGYEAIIYSYSDGTSITKMVVQDEAGGSMKPGIIP